MPFKLNIKHTLYYSLAIINLMTIFLGVVAWAFFNLSAKSLHVISNRDVPTMQSVSSVIAFDAGISDFAAQMLNATTTVDVEKIADNIDNIFERSTREIEALENILEKDNSKLTEIKHHFNSLKTVLRSYQEMIVERIGYEKTKRELFEKLLACYSEFITEIQPVSDDVQFDLIIGLEDKNTQKYLIDKAYNLSTVLHIEVEGNLLFNILESVMLMDEIEKIIPFKERFDASVGRIEREMSSSNFATQNISENYFNKVKSMGFGGDNIFTMQENNLKLKQELQKQIMIIQKATMTVSDSIHTFSEEAKVSAMASNNNVRQQIKFGKITISLVAFFSVVFTALLSWKYVRKRVIDRMSNLEKVMSEISDNKFESVIQGRNDQDEIGRMARSVFTFRESMIENELLNTDLEEALREARRADEIKSEFLANMSHELRTPLNSIIGLSHMLCGDLEKESEEYEMVQTVYRSSQSLLHIVNDILDLSKIEAKQVTLENIGFDFRKTMEGVIDLCAPMASSKGLSLRHVYKDDIPYLTGDPARLGRILINLVGNAIKYTLDGVIDVEINCRKVSSESIVLNVLVKDTGIGIPEDRLDSVFQKFSQADETTTRKFGGTGLGLAITKELVLMMGGDIGVTSELNNGSTFWFEIPFEITDIVHDANEAIESLNTEQSHKNKTPLVDAKILVAEDHELNQIFIKKLLKRTGIKFFELVENGAVAVETYEKGEYDLILMDCHMPEMNGYDATKAIRMKEGGTEKHTPIIALTADAMVGAREKCINAGMDDYLTKPINGNLFRQMLEQWFVFDVDNTENVQEDSREVDIDFSILDEFADTDEEKEAFFTLFKNNVEEELGEMSDMCIDGQNKAWVEAAHKMKGGAGMIGAIKLASVCDIAQGMEVASASEREAQLKIMKEAYEAVKKEFHKGNKE